MRRRAAAASAVAAVAVVALAFAQPAGAFARAGTSPASKIKATLNVIGPQNGGGEPSVAIGPEGNIYVSAPGSGMEFWRSTDHGKTFTQGSSPESPSGDTSVNVDSSGAVYETNLNVISGTNTLQVDVFKSFDFGATWPQKGTSTLESSNSSGQPLLVDRQWVDAYIPPGKTTDQAQVYVTYHDFGPGTMWVSSSSDGGKTFGLPTDIINDPVAAADSFCNTIPGSVKVVPNGSHAGRVYVAWLAADPANPATGCNETQLAAFHTVWIAYSDDNGATWKDQLVFDGGLLHDGSEIFADMTLDNQGNPYVAFSMNLKDEFDVWVEASFDGGQTWNGKSDGTGQPYQANVDKGTHYFASISAGNPGQIDVAFIRTDTIVGTLPNGKPDPSTDSTASWNVYAAQSKTLLSGTPKFKVVKLSTSPMHVGDVCTLGLFCAAVPGTNRDILDFIDVAVDHSGLFHVAYTDDNNYAAGALVMANQVAGPTVGSGGH